MLPFESEKVYAAEVVLEYGIGNVKNKILPYPNISGYGQTGHPTPQVLFFIVVINYRFIEIAC